MLCFPADARRAAPAAAARPGDAFWESTHVIVPALRQHHRSPPRVRVTLPGAAPARIPRGSRSDRPIAHPQLLDLPSRQRSVQPARIRRRGLRRRYGSDGVGRNDPRVVDADGPDAGAFAGAGARRLVGQAAGGVRSGTSGRRCQGDDAPCHGGAGAVSPAGRSGSRARQHVRTWDREAPDLSIARSPLRVPRVIRRSDLGGGRRTRGRAGACGRPRRDRRGLPHRRHRPARMGTRRRRKRFAGALVSSTASSGAFRTQDCQVARPRRDGPRAPFRSASTWPAGGSISRTRSE